MGLFDIMWDLGIAPMNATMAIISLSMLFLLRSVAKTEMKTWEEARNRHIADWTITKSRSSDSNYCHGLYIEYKALYGDKSYHREEAFADMQKYTKAYKVGDLYRPFDAKPTLVTRVLMLRIGGKH